MHQLNGENENRIKGVLQLGKENAFREIRLQCTEEKSKKQKKKTVGIQNSTLPLCNDKCDFDVALAFFAFDNVPCSTTSACPFSTNSMALRFLAATADIFAPLAFFYFWQNLKN